MMKFSKLKYELKNDKSFLLMFIFSCLIISVDIIMLVFDMIELLVANEYSAALGNGFLIFNIIVICLNFVFLLSLFYILLIKKNNK